MRRTLSGTFGSLAVAILALSWSAPASAVTVPYFEDFESEATCGTSCGIACPLGPSGWTNDTTDSLDWTVDVNGTSSSNTGPSGDHTSGAGNYLYIETSTPCNGGGQTANLISPPVDLSGTSTPAAAFWYHMYGVDMGTLHVDVSTDGGMTWTNDIVPPWTDNVNAWQRTGDIDLSAFVGQVVHLRIRGVVGAGFGGDMAIDDVAFFEPVPDDLGAETVQVGGSVCGEPAATITTTIRNYGSADQSAFSLQYVVDGGAPVVETYTGPAIAAYGDGSYSFMTTADLSAAGPHVIEVTVLLPGDADASNDSATTTFTTLAGAVSTFPSLDDFEGGSRWISGGTNSTWALGTPAKTVISGAYSGANAWVTGGLGTGLYAANELSYIQSACGYDFSSLTNPAIRLAIWWEAELSWDGAVLQSSTDGGVTWNDVGALGDPLNWYNDGTINGLPGAEDGWTGRNGSGSNGWVLAAHHLDGLAGAPSVMLRVLFGADAIVHDDGVAVDDIYVFDSVAQLGVSQIGPDLPISAVPADATQVLVEHFALEAGGASDLDVTSLTITQIGTIGDADVAAVDLWLDNGDGKFSPATDTLLETGVLAGGSVTFAGAAPIHIPVLGIAHLFVTADLAGTANPGDTLGVAIAAEADVGVTPVTPVVFANPPIQGPERVVYGVANTLPFSDPFDASAVMNRTATFAQSAAYPTAMSAGSTVGATTLVGAADAWVGLLSEATVDVGTTIQPNSPGYMAALSFPNGAGAAALDYAFDLDAYGVATDLVWLRFFWNNAGEEDSELDNVFVSVDGGATWIASLYHFPFSTPQQPGWTLETVDLSASLAAAGSDFTDQVLVRFQVGGAEPPWMDGLFVDDVWLGTPPELLVERPVGTAFATGATDDVGPLAAGAQSLTYELTNLGHLPLTIDEASLTSSGESNVSNVALIVASPTVAPGGSTALTIEFDVDGAGAFGLDLAFAADDPRLVDGFTLHVMGEGLVPEIDVQRPAGTSLASGSTDAVGTVSSGEEQTLTYTIANTGGADLLLTGTPGYVAIENASNATASVATQPGSGTVAAGGTESFGVTYQATAAGAFSFDLVIPSDDADEAEYRITVSGTGEETTAPDAGVGPDGGTDPEPGDDGGCGCRASSGGQPLGTALMLLLAFGFVLLRRRQTR